MKKVYPLFILFLVAQWSIGQNGLPSSIANEKKAVIQSLEAKKQQYVDVASNIWWQVFPLHLQLLSAAELQ
jgi:hypothetical protein